MPGGKLAHLARAHEENAPADEPGEDLLRQLDGGERDGHRMPRDLRLRPHLLRHGEGLREQRVEGGPDRLARLGEGERVFHLPQDLRLAEHHRVEARGDAKRVPNGLALGVGVEHRVDGGRVDAAVTAEMPERRGARLARHLGDGIHLDPVTGRQDQRLADHAGRGDVAEHLAQLVLVDRELFPQLHRSVAMRDAGDEERHSIRRACPGETAQRPA